MMYKKALLFKDLAKAKLILQSENPRVQKQLGREVENFVEQIWNEEAMKIVFAGNYAKFSQNSNLKNALLETGQTVLVEGSPKEVVWGIGISESDPDRFDVNKWRGKNLLGKILMEVRDRIRKECGQFSNVSHPLSK